MNILITGASGLIGTTLTNALTNRNATIYRLVRRPPQNALEITWQPDNGHLDVAALPQLDAVVHLAGEN
ncbi:MAG: NAD-dependent epimerase/dehydratase family protein, partial [Candidatus Latescibacterota bacterium]